MAGHGKHKSNGVFTGCNGIGFWGIDYGDSLFGGFFNIDTIDTYASTSNDFQIGSRIDDFFGDFGLASGDDGIIITNDLAQFIFFHIRLDIYNKFFFQDFFGFFSYVGGDENSIHVCSPF